MQPIALSVVLPIYNEQDNISILHAELKQALEALGRRYEIMYVDDGSSDASFLRLSYIAAHDATVTVLRFRRNFGQTAALAAGIDRSRGEIIVFHPPHCKAGHNDSSGVCTSPQLGLRQGLAGTTFVKRVIGLPGETVWARGGHVFVKDKGKKAIELKEPYTDGQATNNLPRQRIPKGYYLMLGDNRSISEDSRIWGVEPRDGLIGIARVRYWPLGRLGIL